MTQKQATDMDTEYHDGGDDVSAVEKYRKMMGKVHTYTDEAFASRAAIAELDAERDKWEWVARDACRELAYETHVNPQSPLDYRLAQWRTREGGEG